MPYRQSNFRMSLSVLITLIIALALAALVLVQSAHPAGAMTERATYCCSWADVEGPICPRA